MEVSYKEIGEFFDIHKDKMIQFEYDTHLCKTKITFEFKHKEEIMQYWNNKGYANFTNLTLIFTL